jgi:hypothetical protein
LFWWEIIGDVDGLSSIREELVDFVPNRVSGFFREVVLNDAPLVIGGYQL